VTCDAVTARVIGFDPRKLRSVTQPERVTTHPLGPWRPADVRVITSWGGGLNTIYQASIAPELHVYSWLGHVEADDFHPPQVQAVAWDPETADLRVQVRDPAGVAWVRVGYETQGQRCVQDLSLAAGDSVSGEWRVTFPVGSVLDKGELAAGDRLYNEGSQGLTW
jgi:hypothetical protein